MYAQTNSNYFINNNNNLKIYNNPFQKYTNKIMEII